MRRLDKKGKGIRDKMNPKMLEAVFYATNPWMLYQK